ncbi:MAG: glycosyl transferase family protein [Microgenomates bacterium 39_7]|nr:MAG: glycosyl transferase family protein [Microgenomates bacterium 39_7]
MKLSVVVNTKNAGNTLADCLTSVTFADELIVVDMHSIDRTKLIAQEYKAKFFLHDDLGYVEPARNYAISQATHEMILVVDADEVVSDGLKKKIQDILSKKTSADVYLIPRKNMVFGQWLQHTGWWPDYQARLFKKGKVSWSEAIHQPPLMLGKVVKLSPEADHAFIHHHYPTVHSYLERMNRYTNVQAEHSLKGFADKVSVDDVISSFYNEFFRRFFVLSGYKDGIAGIGLSFLQSTYELTVQLKKWERQTESNSSTDLDELAINSLELSRSSLNYWLADWRVKHSKGLLLLYWKLRRKFKI